MNALETYLRQMASTLRVLAEGAGVGGVISNATSEQRYSCMRFSYAWRHTFVTFWRYNVAMDLAVEAESEACGGW